jgi:membrane-associated phospholipid phosphatase
LPLLLIFVRDSKKILKILLAMFLSLTIPPLAIAEESWQSSDPDASLAHFPSKLFTDIPRLISLDNMPVFTIGTIGTAFDWGAYDPANTLASNLVQLNIQPIFDFGNFYGEGWVEGGAALGSWSIGTFVKDPRMQEFGRDATESLILSNVLATGLKYAVGRERPDDSNNLSFPSGHAITAFCIAPVVTKYWGWEAGIPAYTLATVTAFARVEGYHHYLSDCLASATLGIIIGNTVVRPTKDVSLSAGPGQTNLKLAFN